MAAFGGETCCFAASVCEAVSATLGVGSGVTVAIGGAGWVVLAPVAGEAPEGGLGCCALSQCELVAITLTEITKIAIANALKLGLMVIHPIAEAPYSQFTDASSFAASGRSGE